MTSRSLARTASRKLPGKKADSPKAKGAKRPKALRIIPAKALAARLEAGETLTRRQKAAALKWAYAHVPKGQRTFLESLIARLALPAPAAPEPDPKETIEQERDRLRADLERTQKKLDRTAYAMETIAGYSCSVRAMAVEANNGCGIVIDGIKAMVEKIGYIADKHCDANVCGSYDAWIGHEDELEQEGGAE